MILFFIIKKVFIVKSFLIVFAVLGAFFLFSFLGEQDITKPTGALPGANKVIVLDPGHGGFDGGAVANGLLEKDVNLDVALRVREYLEQSGNVVILTRDEDVSTALEGKTGISAKKSDLVERKNYVDSGDADIFVSIHMNKFPQSQYKGAQVFYSAFPEDSKRLGEEIQRGLKDVLQDDNQRVAKKIDGGVFLLKNTQVPSVIVECGFLSNPQEAEFLKKDEYRQKLAWGIHLGIIRFFNQ